MAGKTVETADFEAAAVACSSTVVANPTVATPPPTSHPDGGAWGEPFKSPSGISLSAKQVKSKVDRERKKTPTPFYLVAVSASTLALPHLHQL